MLPSVYVKTFRNYAEPAICTRSRALTRHDVAVTPIRLVQIRREACEALPTFAAGHYLYGSVDACARADAPPRNRTVLSCLKGRNPFYQRTRGARRSAGCNPARKGRVANQTPRGCHPQLDDYRRAWLSHDYVAGATVRALSHFSNAVWRTDLVTGNLRSRQPAAIVPTDWDRCPTTESNRHLVLRRDVSYPLDQSGASYTDERLPDT